MPAERIVSLLPSTTEIACALGLEAQLVGRSHECDFPPSVKSLPPLTEPKLDASRASAAIDRDVRRLVSEGLSVYRVDAEKLRALSPDVILTQSHCEVCAASPKDLEAALCEWLGARPAILSLEPTTLGDVWTDIARAAEVLGVPLAGQRLAAELAERVTSVAERAMRVKERPSVACIEWIDPLMAAGNWMPEIVTLAGGRTLFGVTGQHSPWMSFEELRASDPDVIAVMPCGFDLARTRSEMRTLVATPGWSELRAVRRGRVFLTDGNQYFNRPGPRLVESLEILAQVVHPDVFAPLAEGTGWQRLQGREAPAQ
jgi:iron complex transport system substrate-binding protein